MSEITKRSFSTALFAFAVSGAAAHSWYPSECCSDRDCAPLREENVRIVPGGYSVVVHPGSPPTVTRRAIHFVPYSALRKSPDGAYHICIDATETKILCFYGPIPGT